MTRNPYEDREQTEVKHRILARYLSALVPIVGDWASDITYIDCLAGPWESADPKLNDTSFARAIDVLRSTSNLLRERNKRPTIRCLLIERDPKAFRLLKQYSDSITDLEVTAENWDLADHIQDVITFAQARKKSFPFLFIDPQGWELLPTVAPLLTLDSGEVLINFMTSWITRFISDSNKHFDRLFGADWARLVKLRGEVQEEELVKAYVSSVRAAGTFKYVCTLPVMKPDKNAFHFHMIYATRHIRGVEEFKKTEKNVIPFMHETRAQGQARREFLRSGQHSLLSPEETYRETKFRNHQLRSLESAKADLRQKFESLGQLSFDEAWATAMQHSGVTDDDFQQWIRSWSVDGHIQAPNQQSGRKFTREKQPFFKWIQKP